MPTVDEVVTEVFEFGNEPEDLANLLWVANARGKKSSSYNCPLAVYFKNKLGLKDEDVCVRQDLIRITIDGNKFTYDPPVKVSRFIAQVDNGVYADVLT